MNSGQNVNQNLRIITDEKANEINYRDSNISYCSSIYSKLFPKNKNLKPSKKNDNVQNKSNNYISTSSFQRQRYFTPLKEKADSFNQQVTDNSYNINNLKEINAKEENKSQFKNFQEAHKIDKKLDLAESNKVNKNYKYNEIKSRIEIPEKNKKNQITFIIPNDNYEEKPLIASKIDEVKHTEKDKSFKEIQEEKFYSFNSGKRSNIDKDQIGYDEEKAIYNSNLLFKNKNEVLNDQILNKNSYGNLSVNAYNNLNCFESNKSSIINPSLKALKEEIEFRNIDQNLSLNEKLNFIQQKKYSNFIKSHFNIDRFKSACKYEKGVKSAIDNEFQIQGLQPSNTLCNPKIENSNIHFTKKANSILHNQSNFPLKSMGKNIVESLSNQFIVKQQIQSKNQANQENSKIKDVQISRIQEAIREKRKIIETKVAELNHLMKYDSFFTSSLRAIIPNRFDLSIS